MSKNPFDGPGFKPGSKEFKEMVLGVMINKHNDPDEDFDLGNDISSTS